MNPIDVLNDKFQPAFEKFAKKHIEKEAKKYHKKYPFVKRLSVGMGSASAIDADGVHCFDINWPALDALIAAEPERDEDEILEEHTQIRTEAEEDDFLTLLQQLQSHPMRWSMGDIYFE